MLAVRRPTEDELWEELCALPPHLKGELVDGQLHVQPRPRYRHQNASGRTYAQLDGAFGGGVDGPDGWVIVQEPGIELPGAREVSPDVAGWRGDKAKMVDFDEPITVAPDWVCEVRSPSNKRWQDEKNRQWLDDTKIPFYGRHGVEWMWLIAPLERTIQVWRLVEGDYRQVSTHSEGSAVAIPPFESAPFDVERLWRR